ncbi:major facilitator superfamily domain-containing protein [Aspergillus avenaceus]|uniref:Major facilitator superfamily domain-containing protein n=1 Tax=Aspergillus avenaceus TaxID=36643 RepID=A0A5N6TVG3_ASPAV|nr:major facilitator superfamily domain-containing protein [Aspergillus avenaceus]
MPPQLNDHSNDFLDREDAPFLPADADAPTDRKPGHAQDELDSIDKNIRNRLIFTLFAMIMAVEVGIAMANGPLTRICESIACREYYATYDPTQLDSTGQVDEALCKVQEVQTELAAVKGYMEFFDGILSVFLAIPYGLLADRRGRKSTLCLSVPGFVLYCLIVLVVLWFSDIFPLRAVWAAAIAWVVGGGPVVAFAIMWTMMADVTTDEERSSMFFKFGVAGMAADFVTNAVSSALMTLNPWMPLLIGWAVLILGTLLALTLPETMYARRPQPVELTHLPTPDTKRDSTDTPPDPHDNTTLKTYYQTILTPYTFILANKQLLLLLTAFLVYRLSRGSSWFLVQYISVRYDWSIASANLLVSFKPALTIPLFLIILPSISKHLLRTLSSTQKDLRLSRASIVLLTLGTLGIGLSPSIPPLIASLIVQTAGSGFVYTTRSLVATLVEREQTARLFTIIEVLQSVGSVIASLTITPVFQAGLQLGGVWVGLAWMMTSSAFVGVGVSIWLFREPSRKVDVESESEF